MSHKYDITYRICISFGHFSEMSLPRDKERLKLFPEKGLTGPGSNSSY